MTLIAQITDLHMRARGIPAYRVVESNMLAERAVDAVNALDPQPDFVIVTGDLADKGLEEDYVQAKETLGRLKAPYASIAGNHDSAAQMKKSFSDHAWASQMPGDSLQFTIDIGDIRLIGLNSAVEGKAHGFLDDHELEWLTRELDGSRDRPVVLVIHHPPILTGVSHMDRINLKNADALADVIRDRSNILRILCGHDHRPVFAPFAGTYVTISPATAHQVALDLKPDGPSAFVFEPPAYLLHSYTPQTGLVTNMAYVERFPGPYPFWSDKSFTWP